MGKQGVPQRGGVAHRRLGGKILRARAAATEVNSGSQQRPLSLRSVHKARPRSPSGSQASGSKKFLLRGQNTPYYNAMYTENPVPQLCFALYKLPNPVILELRLIGKYGEHNGKTNRRRGTLPPGGPQPQPHRTGVQPARHRLPGHSTWVSSSSA